MRFCNPTKMQQAKNINFYHLIFEKCMLMKKHHTENCLVKYLVLKRKCAHVRQNLNLYFQVLLKIALNTEIFFNRI